MQMLLRSQSRSRKFQGHHVYLKQLPVLQIALLSYCIKVKKRKKTRRDHGFDCYQLNLIW